MIITQKLNFAERSFKERNQKQKKDEKPAFLKTSFTEYKSNHARANYVSFGNGSDWGANIKIAGNSSLSEMTKTLKANDDIGILDLNLMGYAGFLKEFKPYQKTAKQIAAYFSTGADKNNA